MFQLSRSGEKKAKFWACKRRGMGEGFLPSL